MFRNFSFSFQRPVKAVNLHYTFEGAVTRYEDSSVLRETSDTMVFGYDVEERIFDSNIVSNSDSIFSIE